MITIFCDGGSRGNPGPAASACVVFEGEKIIFQEGKYLGVETNNVAEYIAVLLAIEWLTKQYKVLSPEYIVINLDSQLVERQLNGKYKIKNEKLKLLADEIKLKIKNYKLQIKFQWGYRSNNKIADELVNKTLDSNKQNDLNFIHLASTGK